MKLRTLSPALQEIVGAAQWFNSQRRGLGDEFWQSMDALLERIEANPLQFAKSDFSSADRDIRFAVVRRFNYVVHFLIDSDQILVISVAHAARKPGYWLRRITT